MPVLLVRGLGEGRGSHLAVSAAALMTSTRRGSLKCRSRYSTGSAFARAASSSIKPSWAKVFCKRAGDRSGPVQKGEGVLCMSDRSDLIVPVPFNMPPTCPATYDGTPLLLLLNDVGSGDGDLARKGS